MKLFLRDVLRNEIAQTVDTYIYMEVRDLARSNLLWLAVWARFTSIGEKALLEENLEEMCSLKIGGCDG